jgi:hypothetical protein
MPDLARVAVLAQRSKVLASALSTIGLLLDDVVGGAILADDLCYHLLSIAVHRRSLHMNADAEFPVGVLGVTVLK